MGPIIPPYHHHKLTTITVKYSIVVCASNPLSHPYFCFFFFSCLIFIRFGDDEAVSPLNGLLKVRGVPPGSWLQVRVARVLPEGKVDLELVDQ